ncbi:MAG: hypothetical protein IJV70_01725 [Clostridia bacterium]|nr:hypothetical protein [Clostridia bacterium]
MMKFLKNNAYPEISLHDKAFKLVKLQDGIKFVFSDGFIHVCEDGNKDVKGEIVINNIDPDEFRITCVKPFNFFGYHRMITRDLTFAEFERIFDNYELEIFDEYYAYNSFIWRCAFKPYDKKIRRKYYQIEIEVYSESPLEYFIDE